MISMLVMTSYLSRTALISFPLFLQEYFTEVRGGAEKAYFIKIPPTLSPLLRDGATADNECNNSFFHAEFNSGEEQYDCKFSLKGIS
jgi:hypothetical protein